jgi:hypothetical protein
MRRKKSGKSQLECVERSVKSRVEYAERSMHGKVCHGRLRLSLWCVVSRLDCNFELNGFNIMSDQHLICLSKTTRLLVSFSRAIFVDFPHENFHRIFLLLLPDPSPIRALSHPFTQKYEWIRRDDDNDSTINSHNLHHHGQDFG